MFERVARNRWVRPGQSCDPEPPTVVARWDPTRSLPVVLLGGPPLEAHAQLFQRHDVQLVISCVRESIADEPRCTHPGVYRLNLPFTDPMSRQESWTAVRQCLFNTLAAEGSVYIHCAAGVYHAPCIAAVVVAQFKVYRSEPRSEYRPPRRVHFRSPTRKVGTLLLAFWRGRLQAIVPVKEVPAFLRARTPEK